MQILSKFLSRRLLVVFGAGGCLPVVFHTLGISESVTLASLGLASAYLVQRAVKG